jgi:formate dehydrogenase major subunit
MKTARITIDGKEIFAKPDQSIFQVCGENDIHIPTLCHDDQLQPTGSCGMCTVDLKDHGLAPSCSTPIADGMVIETQGARVVSARKQVLESLLSDHYGDCTAPCRVACPAGLDIQGYLSLIARGAYLESVGLIKERLPLPGVIGRICPRPCETACRRNLVDQPIAICSLKRFVGDHELSGGERVVPPIKAETGYRVAIVGSGPAGLTAAYYLLQEGHGVAIFEALPDAGGMLRYGIPDYRLPKDILEKEVETITGMGATLKTNHALGKNFGVKDLFKDGFHAVFLAIGAHESQKMYVEGEDTRGVLPGTDFLRSVALGNPVKPGRRVAVIGGGNTACDAARSALRLGAEEVTIVYRRSRTEMPANVWEVEEAEEEGLKIHFLAAPIKIVAGNGAVSGIKCVRMALGEPDRSGRRRPEPIPNSEFLLKVDSVVAAIGQRPDLSVLADAGDIKIDKTKIVAHTDTMLTSMKGVFSGGDCVTGPATAVEAIAAGRKAAVAIDRYVRDSQPEKAERLFNVSKGPLDELPGREEFVQVEHVPRQKMPVLRPIERRTGFQEMELGYTEDMAKREAERCLGCGCKAEYDCTLRHLATEYDIPSIPRANQTHYPLDLSHPFIVRDANKCIGCERCVRICYEVQCAGALRMLGRVTTPDGYGGALQKTTCESCGQCVTTCPVGALASKDSLKPTHEVKTVCPYCGCGCGLYLGVRGNAIVNVRGDAENPIHSGNLCVKGRFGHGYIDHPDRLTSPLIRKDGRLVKVDWDEALDLVTKKFSQYKEAQFATIASAKCTNEENYLLQKFTRAVMGTNNIDHCARL